MDALRRIAYAEGISSPEPDSPLFHRIFLGTISRFGRVFEAGLMGVYNVFSGNLLKDVEKAPTLFLKGKLSLLPPRVGSRRDLKRIVAQVRAKEAAQR
jgi:heterodisulfide reductase subunit C